MFNSARIKLTAWYLAIIMLISISFSMAIYRVLTFELNQVERMHRLRVERRLPDPNFFNEFSEPQFLDPIIIEDAKNHLKLILISINLIILGTSALAGYFLAGRTLKPILDMLEDQKRFVADASHELRTPLTAIKTETEVSLRDKNLNLQSAKKLLISNLEEIDKLKSLTDYFLNLSQYQSSQTKFSIEQFNLADICRHACLKLLPLAKQKKITFVQKFSKIVIQANKTSIDQLINILLDNAIKYSHPNSKIIIKLATKGNNALIKIQDFGIGIKAANIPHIFNRFYRADFSRAKNAIKGYGLGLAIAKSIIILHHGKISVNSILGKGSTFTASVPLKQNREVIKNIS